MFSISALSVVVGSLGPSMLSDPCCFAFWGFRAAGLLSWGGPGLASPNPSPLSLKVFL